MNAVSTLQNFSSERLQPGNNHRQASESYSRSHTGWARNAFLVRRWAFQLQQSAPVMNSNQQPAGSQEQPTRAAKGRISFSSTICCLMFTCAHGMREQRRANSTVTEPLVDLRESRHPRECRVHRQATELGKLTTNSLVRGWTARLLVLI